MLFCPQRSTQTSASEQLRSHRLQGHHLRPSPGGGGGGIPPSPGGGEQGAGVRVSGAPTACVATSLRFHLPAHHALLQVPARGSCCGPCTGTSHAPLLGWRQVSPLTHSCTHCRSWHYAALHGVDATTCRHHHHHHFRLRRHRTASAAGGSPVHHRRLTGVFGGRCRGVHPQRRRRGRRGPVDQDPTCVDRNGTGVRKVPFRSVSPPYDAKQRARTDSASSILRSVEVCTGSSSLVTGFERCSTIP